MNKNQKVEDFLSNLDHPLKAEMMAVRDIILGVDSRMAEEIKWGAPTFTYKGNLATYNVRAKKFVNLTFHTGALIPDPTGVLEGDAKEARVMRFANMDEVESKREGLISVVKSWIELQDG
ncbi:MAG: DUF1801 domain-containing protein [Bacteroidota bacterium]